MLTLMKGDKVVETAKYSNNSVLFCSCWKRYSYLLNVRIMDMNN